MNETSPAPAPKASALSRMNFRPSRSFNWFLASTFFSAVGRNSYNIACAWILVAQGYGTSAVATLFAIISLSELMASPAAGWLSDHFARRFLSALADAIRLAAALMLGALLIVMDTSWTIWFSAILFACCDRIALTSSQSMIPSIKVGVSLPTANSFIFLLMQLGSLAAAALTGILLHFFSPTHTFAVIALAFALSAGCMMAFRQMEADGATRARHQPSTPTFDASLLQIIANYALLYSGGLLVSVIGPSFIFEELKGNAVDFGQLESAWSAGSIAGALLLIPLIRAAKISVLQFGVLLLTAAFFTFLKASTIPWALVAFAILGALYNLGRVGIEVTLQTAVSPSSLGRIKGAMHSVAVLLGLVLFGAIAGVGNAVLPSTVFLAYGLVLAEATSILAICRLLMTTRT